MKFYGLIILAIFIILMVAFGNTSIKDSQEAYKARMKKGDPLVNAIMEHNDKKNTGPGGFKMMQPPPPPAMNGGIMQQRPPGYQPGYMVPTSPNPLGVPLNPNLPQQMPQQPAAQPAPAQPGNNYYPPPGDSSKLQAPADGKKRELSSKEREALEAFSDIPREYYKKHPIYLSTGQPIGFWGARVFTFNQDGQPIPLPDGKYLLYEGKLQIFVVAGQKLAISRSTM